MTSSYGNADLLVFVVTRHFIDKLKEAITQVAHVTWLIGPELAADQLALQCHIHPPAKRNKMFIWTETVMRGTYCCIPWADWLMYLRFATMASERDILYVLQALKHIPTSLLIRATPPTHPPNGDKPVAKHCTPLGGNILFNPETIAKHFPIEHAPGQYLHTSPPKNVKQALPIEPYFTLAELCMQKSMFSRDLTYCISSTPE